MPVEIEFSTLRGTFGQERALENLFRKDIQFEGLQAGAPLDERV